MSAPFRETNYQPEIFYLTATNWHPFGGSTGVTIGMEHQSNGRSQLLSRSWNRVYTSFMFEKDNFALSLRPWYRIKEDEKENPNESDGDDNPDIEKFMGHFELRSAYRWNDHEFSLMGRNNLRSDNFGAVELGWSFPLTGHLKGFVQYFNGYGESLIDYNHNTERVGVGILLTDLL
ncbi:MAG: phospholipase A1 [Oleiphilaceae bacterium]